MPLYYFHLNNGEEVLLDPEGRECGSADVAVSIALREARAIIGEEARSGTIMMDQRIDIEDDGGTVVHRLRFQDAVRIVDNQPVSAAP